MAAWMLYSLAVGGLLTLGALAMERGMRAARLPQRGAWAAALVLGMAIPAAARWLPRAPEPASAAPSDAPGEAWEALVDLPAATAEPLRRLDLAVLDTSLAIGWAMMSVATVLVLLGAALVLRRRRRGWTTAEVEGVPVLLSRDTGPAVIGLLRSRIVLPAWVLDAAPAERALLLEHEREHVRAGDPRLLALGLAAIVLTPWNPVAWYQLRRLRLAIEVDCDARVLARRTDVRAYGTLLLNVGRRASTPPRLIAAAAFSEPTSFLERRIRVMTSPRPRWPLLRAAGFGAAALLLAATACRAPEPAAPSARPSATAAGGPVTLSVQPRQAVERLYPQVAHGMGDSITVILFYGPDGTLMDHRMTVRGQRMAGGLSSRATLPSQLDMQRYAPGELGPDPVTVFALRQLTAEEIAASAHTPKDTVLVTTVETTRSTGGRR